MKKMFFAAMTILAAQTVIAQETYLNAQMAADDLNGTARYVGMGGAMEALGADISTIGSNPAGIGVFRRSNATVSFGLTTLGDAGSFRDVNKTTASFDQAGFVYSMKAGKKSYFNFAFNYHKSRNFNQILAATGTLDGASQNKVTYNKANNGTFTLYSDGGTVNGYTSSGYLATTFSQLDYLYANALMYDGDESIYYNDATGYTMRSGTTGYIGEYDFNVSGSYDNTIFWGLTVGIKDVHYKGVSSYTETLVDDEGSTIGDVTVDDRRKITGTGIDVKAGIIFRPVTESPFRIGLYVHTPTWYDLTTTNVTTLQNGAYSSGAGLYSSYTIGETYDYKFYTPWKFGISLGHTVDKVIALGATYEFADYGTCDIRVNDGGYYGDYWGGYYDDSHSDEVMNEQTERVLRGVSTLKLGLEVKPMDNVSLRLGYNYVSPMYEEHASKDNSLASYGTYYSSSTDYVNWKSTNRFSIGAGYAKGKWSADLTYLYSKTSGDFYPFESYYDSSDAALNNVADAVDVDNIRHQVLLTLGYKF